MLLNVDNRVSYRMSLHEIDSAPLVIEPTSNVALGCPLLGHYGAWVILFGPPLPIIFRVD